MSLNHTSLHNLAKIEQDEQVKILYACESGSRAWGFPSADSDYDVRFIYVHPLDWYLSVFEKRDVIERPINDQLDISGWDLKKALGVIGSTWYFTTLFGHDYCSSRLYDAAERDELLQIIFILRNLKELILSASFAPSS